jgi:hypothetical protein
LVARHADHGLFVLAKHLDLKVTAGSNHQWDKINGQLLLAFPTEGHTLSDFPASQFCLQG